MSCDWIVLSLGDVLELKRGYDLPQRDRVHGKVPLVSSSGITDYLAKAMVQGPGVVTGRYGTIGQVFYIKDDFWPLNTTLYVRDFKGNDERFISYFLRSIDFLAYSDKAAVPGLNRNHLHQAKVRIPADLEIQRAIAGILGALDDKIELNLRMSETLEAMARALFKSWFVDLDPVSDAADSARGRLRDNVTGYFSESLIDSETGELPEGWTIQPIGALASVVGGTTPKTDQPEYWMNGTYHWATPKDLASLRTPVLLGTARRITDAGLSRIGSGLLPPGTVLLSSRAPIGYLAVTEVPVAINQGFIAMIPKPGISNLFLLHWARHSHDVIVSHANGSTFLEISKANFRPLPVVTPPQPVLRAFDDLAQPLHGRMVACERESLTLAAARDALLPKLISGELRVPDAERIAVEAGA